MPDNPEAAVKSKRPTDSAFKQQRLAAWQPVLTAGSVLPTFFVIGIAFIPVGVALLFFSDEVKEHIIDYTFCRPTNSVLTYIDTCAEMIINDPQAACECEIPFTLDQDFNGRVFMYYGLTNYYQNHRRYVKSMDDDQLRGKLTSTPSSDCDPFQYNSSGFPIAPCGAIANSLFSDELKLNYDDLNMEVPLLNTGIAWPSDKNIKFRNPPGNLTEVLSYFAKPNAWHKELWELDPDNPDNNGFQNEDLIVWMRTAALPTFRKLYRRINYTQVHFEDGLPKGNYTLFVTYRYPVTVFEGTKQMILSTTSLLGAKNPFLGFAYIVIGAVCLILGIILLIIHIKFSKSTAEMVTVVTRS